MTLASPTFKLITLPHSASNTIMSLMRDVVARLAEDESTIYTFSVNAQGKFSAFPTFLTLSLLITTIKTFTYILLNIRSQLFDPAASLQASSFLFLKH